MLINVEHPERGDDRLEERQCPTCGAEFTCPRASVQQYCSVACRPPNTRQTPAKPPRKVGRPPAPAHAELITTTLSLPVPLVSQLDSLVGVLGTSRSDVVRILLREGLMWADAYDGAAARIAAKVREAST